MHVITVLRDYMGMTQQQLGIQSPHLHRYESGGHKCPVAMYQNISDLLEVPIDDLLATYSVADLER